MKLSHEDLRKDLAVDAVLSAARTRRRKRQFRQGGLALTALAILGFVIHLLQPEPPVAIEIAGGTSQETVERISDKELLALLADQKPILVDMGGGRKQLVLSDPLLEKDLVFVE